MNAQELRISPRRRTAIFGWKLLLLTLLTGVLKAQTAPAPTITALVPSSTSAGTRGIFLEVQGTGFFQIIGNVSSFPTVTFRGQTYGASFYSSTQLFVSIPRRHREAGHSSGIRDQPGQPILEYRS